MLLGLYLERGLCSQIMVAMFEPLDEGTFLAIKDDVNTSIRKYLKKVNIGKLQVLKSGETGLKVNLYCAYNDAQIPYFRVGVRV